MTLKVTFKVRQAAVIDSMMSGEGSILSDGAVY